jgi:BASS family bile acid:Na+ symporter
MSAVMLIRIAIVISVMLMVVALGLRTEPGESTYLLNRPSLLARSLIAMNVIMPMIALLLVTSFDLKTPVKVALVALAISPLPPFLPAKRLNLTSHGYIYGIVVATAICSVILVPLTVWLLSWHYHSQHIAVMKVLLVVIVTVLAPLSIGLFIRRNWPARADHLAAILSKLGMGLLILSCIPVIVMLWQTLRSLIGDGTLAAAAVLSGSGLLVGHLMAGSDPQKRTVLALATASRHPGVALVAGISASAQAPRLVTAAVLLAFLVSLIVSAPYAAWRKRVDAATAAADVLARSS